MKRYNVAPWWNDGKDAVCEADDGKYALFSEADAKIKKLEAAIKGLSDHPAIDAAMFQLHVLAAEIAKLKNIISAQSKRPACDDDGIRFYQYW